MAAWIMVVVAETEKFQKDVMADIGLQKILSWGLKLLQDLGMHPRRQQMMVIKGQEST